ncbi:interferon alpha/beta receptor 1 isoform X2 [Xenopus laevis]|uniref:Interferon alpha/beta receptor 1 isoform X2 n=1 Tax=Xenopus laevis TaxID=8355 RepID=A0A8J0UI08_XENLA|nr:interferon alpha/beta receptor 1 isoform X2 [Xenopus laevis]
MAAEPGLLFLSQFCFLLFLPPWTGTLTSGLTYLEPPFNVKVHTLPDKYSVVWDWNNGNREDAKNVTFSVFVRKLKKKPSAQFWSSVPGCLHISHHNCSIDPALIDTDKDYKVQVRAEMSQIGSSSSDPVIFSAKVAGLDGRPYPENVTIDALNTNYMLKWDWDDSLYPNVTFSVEMVAEGAFSDGWKQVNGCENISMLHCDVSSIYIFGTYNFRIAASFDNKNRTLSRALRFHPLQDTTIGPPSDMSTELLATMLQIKLLEPKAFHNNYLKNTCDWEYNLIYWKDSKSDREEKSVKEKLGRFAIEVESSTTYCMKACVECQDSKRRGLFSKKQCITTGAGARTVWSVGIGIGFLVSIVVSAVVVYLCACPFKRYIRHIFYPAGKLPSSIENGMLDSRVKIPFVFQEEEATDVCYIIRNSGLDEDHVQNHKYSLKESSADSGNYSNEDEATGEAYGRWPLHTDNVASSTAIHMDA